MALLDSFGSSTSRFIAQNHNFFCDLPSALAKLFIEAFKEEIPCSIPKEVECENFEKLC